MHVGRCSASTFATVGLARVRATRTDDMSLKAEDSPTKAVAALSHHTFVTLVGVKREFGYFSFFGLNVGACDVTGAAASAPADRGSWSLKHQL